MVLSQLKEGLRAGFDSALSSKFAGLPAEGMQTLQTLRSCLGPGPMAQETKYQQRAKRLGDGRNWRRPSKRLQVAILSDCKKP